MLPIFTKVSWPRTMILVWAMTWTIMVPLFHVHPEVDHRHGNGNHVHAGTAHTVFSPDLECEYTDYVHDLTCSEAAHQHLQVSAHSSHAFDHPEIEFSLLSTPIDRPVAKPGITVSGLPVVKSIPVQRAVSSASSQPVISLTVLFLSTALPLRAPPSQSI
jgi:hypothetical protein